MKKITKDKRDELMNKYPLLYGDRDKSSMQTLICYGLEVGDGWLPLIDELSAKLETMIVGYLNENPNAECEKCLEPKNEHTSTDHVYYPHHPKAAQVKEKYAGLRYYLTIGTQPMFDVISEYESKSYRTCENCGGPGKRYGGGWLVTLCSDCADKDNKSGRKRVACDEMKDDEDG